MKPAARPLRWLWAGLGVLILLTPIGVLAPGTAWGEWGGSRSRPARLRAAGFEKLGGLWKAAMPDYATPGVSNAMLGYLIAAVVGAALVVGSPGASGRCWRGAAGRPDSGAPTPPTVPPGERALPVLPG